MECRHGWLKPNCPKGCKGSNPLPANKSKIKLKSRFIYLTYFDLCVIMNDKEIY